MLIGTALWDEMVGQGNIKPEDWKTNHRIYEFSGEGGRKAELDGMITRGYHAYIDGLLSPRGIAGLAKLIVYNGTARSVVARNLLNRNVLKAFE